MSKRMWALAALPAAVLLAGTIAPSSAAAGNRFIAIDVQHIDYHDATGDSVELQQRIDFPNPGPATRSVLGPNWSSFGAIDFGEMHGFTSGDLTTLAGGTHSIHNGVIESFEDELFFDTGTPGQHGIATFLIHLDGTLESHGAGSAYVYFSSGGTPLFSDIADDRSDVVDAWLTYTTSFTSGFATPIHGALTLGADIFFNGPGTASAVTDFSHTVQWGGLQSVILSSGEDVTHTTTITSGSGFDYSAAISSGAPEPAAWALLLTGFGGLGAALRARRQRTRAA